MYTQLMEQWDDNPERSRANQEWYERAFMRLMGEKMDLIQVIDCTGDNLAAVNPPPGTLMAAYVTGSGGVPWTPDQLARHPGAVLIDQSPIDTPADETADVLDVEDQAATLADIPAWVHGAWTSYQTARRPGQRKPTLYVNSSELTPVANTLNSAGITHGVNLWLAHPMTQQAAIDTLKASGGPFPIIAVQYAFQSLFDVSLFSAQWLSDVSKAPQASTPRPGIQGGWRFCNKCQGLFFGLGQEQSACPKGGQHDGTKSHDYTIGYTQ